MYNLTEREVAIILASLRRQQDKLEGEPSDETGLDDVASGGGKFEPLDAKGIDALAEKLNFPATPAPLSVPTVHLNGTSGKALEKQLRDAHRAGDEFLEKLAQAAPHGRDYYPQGPEAYAKAAREHEARMARVHAVLLELEEIANKLDEFVS